MATDTKKLRFGGTYLLQRTKSALPTVRVKSTAPNPSRQNQTEPTIDLHIDKNSPVHTSQEALRRSGSFVQPQMNDNHANVNEPVSSQVQQPFINNPPVNRTQRDTNGNNLYFNASAQVSGWANIDNEEPIPYMIYRDALKQNLTTSMRTFSSGLKSRYGRSGGRWNHIAQTNTYSGSNLLFIDGTVRPDNPFKYQASRFGYPQLSRPQHTFGAPSLQDLSNTVPALTTKSLDSMTWSATDQLNYRPSISQYSNRYERHAKDGFAYWPTDVAYQKPRCKPCTTGAYKRWLGISDSILKL